MEKLLESQLLQEIEQDLDAVYHRFGAAIDKIIINDLEPTPRMAYLLDYIGAVLHKHSQYLDNKPA